MDAVVILQQMCVILILVVIGIWLYKIKILNDTVTKNLSWMIVNICNPMTLLAMVTGGTITTTHGDFTTGLILCVLLYGFLCLFGMAMPHILHIRDAEQKLYYNIITIYTNTGFMGIPLAKALLSDNEMIYVIICNILFTLVFYSHGIQLLSAKKEAFRIRNLINPGIIMAVLAILIYWFNIHLPNVAVSVITYAGNPTVFLSMILLGASLAKQPILENMKDAKLWLFIAIRMLAFPVALVLFLRAAGIDGASVRTYCLMMALPIANIPLIQSEKEGRDTTFLSKAIMMTTVVSFITVPFIMSILF
jgi:predicted permease